MSEDPPASRRSDSPYATTSGADYLSSLSRFIQTHESSLAAYYGLPSASASRRTNASNAPVGGGGGGPSWGTILSLGILPSSSETNPSPASSLTTPRREPVVLKFDPHHLYYILLKFDELGLPISGQEEEEDSLNIKLERGKTHSKPMILEPPRSQATTSTGTGMMLEIINEGSGSKSPSLFSGFFGGGGGTSQKKKMDVDERSVTSGKSSSFSFGSGWWGLGSTPGSRTSTTTTKGSQEDEASLVRYVYSSCTKLPALKLSPFILTHSSLSTSSRRSSSSQLPPEAVEGFLDCPPPSTCVPLSLFHSLTSLYLEDLDPRSFIGWEKLAIQLRKLEVVRGGIEDVGELVCDCVVEDEERVKRRREGNGAAEETVGESRRKRSEASSTNDDSSPTTKKKSLDCYPQPSKLAWSFLRHLSLHDNSLTFIPSQPLSHLSLLTSLDLSSNLLISVPPSLSSLPCLRSLNLRDNMIDNLHSLPSILGAIEVLNLSQNRLENLSGLDRLLALERLDLRGNRVWEALEVSRLSRLPRLKELWVKENPFSRDVVEGGEENWRVKCFAYFKEERLHDENEKEEGSVRIDGKFIEGRTEKKLVEMEVLKRTGGGGGARNGMMRRRASEGLFGVNGNGSRSRERESTSTTTTTNGNGPKKVVVEPRRRNVTAPLSARQREPSTTNDVDSPCPSLSSSPVVGGGIPPPLSSPTKAQAGKRRKPRRIVDLDGAPLMSPANSLPLSPGCHQTLQSDSDDLTSTTTNGTSSSGPETARVEVPSLETPSTPSTPTKQRQKFASSPSRIGISPNAFPSSSPMNSPSNSRISSSSRKERVSLSTYEAPEMNSNQPSAASGTSAAGGGGGEALRKKIEKLREEVGENWLSVLGEREARATQEQERVSLERKKKREEEKQQEEVGGSNEEQKQGSEQAGEAAGHDGREEPSIEGLAVSAGVEVVQKKKGKKKKGKGK
ncbi:leucine-rich repeat domain-containing protein [Sporobolomyces salmoneus]|uniref:leucine-rich repeat domain-containing protein n=1 Tax=Sporobolomyces salmoneus TaxID=183962 RepID=UPI0031731104